MTVRPDAVLTKDANENLNYIFDWTDWIGATTIATSTYTISEAPDAILTKDNEAIVAGSKKTSVRLLGGTFSKKYRITNKITTTDSPVQTVERSFYVRVINA